MGQLQDTMFREYPLVVRDVTAAQFAVQSANAPQNPGIMFRVDGLNTYRWNGSAWVAHADEHDAMGGVGGGTVYEEATSFTVTSQAELDALIPTLIGSGWYDPLVTQDPENLEVAVHLSGRGPYQLKLCGANLAHVVFTGEPDIPVTVTSIQATGSTVGTTTPITLQLDAVDLSGAAVGDWFCADILMTGSLPVFTGGTNPISLHGGWVITNIDDANNRITITLRHPTAATIGTAVALPSGAVAGLGKIVRTKFALELNAASASAKDCNLTACQASKSSVIFLYPGTLCSGTVQAIDHSNVNSGMSVMALGAVANYQAFVRNDVGIFVGQDQGSPTGYTGSAACSRNMSSMTIESSYFIAGACSAERSGMIGIGDAIFANTPVGLSVGGDCSIGVNSAEDITGTSCPSLLGGATLNTRTTDGGLIYAG